MKGSAMLQSLYGARCRSRVCDAITPSNCTILAATSVPPPLAPDSTCEDVNFTNGGRLTLQNKRGIVT